ncbi:peptidase inhibitor family I36 protein [Streptomyces sp. SudanB25_2051]|uniref:peptidase inhibitor family I36 protein n=1 Tax=Streptomyces sp. SudanB25_2051 TaxID=3035275 RepID=UPI003F564611
MKKNLAVSLGALALGVASLVGVGSATAGAAPSQGSALPAVAEAKADAAAAKADAAAAKARVTKVQVFQDAKYKNRNTTFTKNVKNLKDVGWNDTISSAKNKGNRAVTFYQHANYKGARFTLLPGESEPHFGDHSGMHDSTSSIKFS